MGITADDLPLERALRWERERADRVFLTQPSGGRARDWTWGQAIDESRRMAAYLKAQQWEPGARVAILSKNSAWWIMADLAIWMSGHVSVPVYPSLRAETVRQILDHSGARACFVGGVEQETAPAAAAPGIPVIAFPNASVEAEVGWEGLVEANTALRGAPVRNGDDVATILYTSGTTGRPKGVVHRFHGFAHDAKVLSELLGLREEERALSYLPLAHILERAGGEAVALRLANRVYFTEGVHTFVQDLMRARPTIFLSVPRLLTKFQQGVFAKAPRERLDRLLRIPAVRSYVRRKILRQLGLNCVYLAACGGAPLPVDVLLWFRKLGVDLAEGYGMSETMITHLPRPGTVRPGCVGAPVEGVETRVTAEGELLVRSPMNMLGYYKEPEMTRQAFTEDGFFRTGDVVATEPDGQIRIVGRLKEQFKTSKGKYITPAPIETRFMEDPAVEVCCLMGAGQSSPFAVVVLSEAVREKCADAAERRRVEASLAARMGEINAGLDPFERLDMIVIANGPWTIGNGLMTPTLKIRRGVVEDRYQQLIDTWRAQNSAVVWESVPGAASAVYTAGAAGLGSEEHGGAPLQ
jgi:long-chain acyl-CoA synthetase